MKRAAAAAGLVAVGLVGLAVGVASRRMRSGPPAPPFAGPRDAAAAEAAPAAPPAAPRSLDAGADARAGAAPDLVAASAAIAARLYQCWPASEGWRAGRLALGRFELSASGALVRGAVLPERPDESDDSGAIPAAPRACFDHALAAEPADAGTTTTVWFPLAFAQSTADGGPGQAPRREPPIVDLLAVPMYYMRSDLPPVIHGDWLGLCGGGPPSPSPPATVSRTIEEERPPTWRPVTLSRTVDEENDAFDDVHLDGCDPAQRLVPVVRGAVITAHPTPARVAAGPRTERGERTIRFGKRRFQIWQDKISEDTSLIALGFDGQIQVLLPDSLGFDYVIVWAGDLDGDHRLDLIITDDETDEPRFSLFLSSRAPPALPVGWVTGADLPGD
ncbi:MAG TPA: hypothetical protein VKZ18_22860 [Polyangia bacterium]|nr:hypothetical protein [Polyangia bacterium]